MAWLNPIIDRTEIDVNLIKQLSEDIKQIGWSNATQSQRDDWNSDNKSCLNYSDLNRIQDNIIYLRDWLESTYGLNITIDDGYTTWILTSDIFIENLNKIRDNIVLLIEGSYSYPTTPIIEYNNPCDLDDVNDIERNLYDLYVILEQIPSMWKNCGTFTCGQNIIL